MKLNLPNKLTLLRIILIPFFVFFLIYPIFGKENDTWPRIIAASIFVLAAFTDFLDGQIARRRGLVTVFGQLMDPLADKFMIFGAFYALAKSDFAFPDYKILSSAILSDVFFWAALIVIFRELAVTSMRLVLSKESGLVVSANLLGKIKTVTQFVCVSVILLEPIVLHTNGFASLILIILMTFFTLWSGLKYFKQNLKFINLSS